MLITQLRDTFFAGKLITLKAVSGPGDEGEPVMTFMLPEED
jgi:hypothetical protein